MDGKPGKEVKRNVASNGALSGTAMDNPATRVRHRGQPCLVTGPSYRNASVKAS
jgi:hypothetical protein